MTFVDIAINRVMRKQGTNREEGGAEAGKPPFWCMTLCLQ
jgi:hypothetical protein